MNQVATSRRNADISDGDTTPVAELGIGEKLVEMLNAGQVFTAGQLAVLLRAEKYEHIAGLGRERIAMLSDRLMEHQIKRTKSKTV